VNENGHPQTLVPSHPGNRNAQRSGVFSRRSLAEDPAVRELAAEIMAQPHVADLDEIGAVEIARLMVLIDRIDADLAERGITRGKAGEARTLLDLRLRSSRRLGEWLDKYGATPLARATWAKQLAEGGLAAEIARRRAAMREGGET
jgi:hypothetical protein